MNQEVNEYTLYSPEIFQILKEWISLFDKIDNSNKGNSELVIKDILSKTKIIEPYLYDFLIEQNFVDDLVNIINNTKTDDQL